MNKVRIISALHERGPSGKGQATGPLYLLEHGLIDSLVESNPDIDFDFVEVNSIDEPASDWKNVLKISMDVRKAVADSIRENHFPVVLASGCLTSIGVVAAIHSNENTKIVWVDMHGDINTPESSKSGNMEGMPLALLTGLFGREVLHELTGGMAPIYFGNVLFVGIRDLDPYEADVISNESMLMISIDDLRNSFREAETHEQLFQGRLGANDTVYLHLDVDALDPEYMPDTMSPTPGGMTVNDIGHLIRSLPENSLRAITITGIMPKPDSTSVNAESIIKILNSTMRRIV